MAARPRWDIFCTVIDNYGDIGVCWRLARQLAAEHGIAVRLWLDDLGALQALCPQVRPELPTQLRQDIEIRQWTTDFPVAEAADVVIEAFGCALPESYLQAMASRARAPAWINLEYLSAEAWTHGCHGMASPHPRLPLTKHFFFPGFTADSGGLLRERDLLARRARAQADNAALWAALALPPPAAGTLAVSLFCYDTAPLPALLAAWRQAASPLTCYLPQGKATRELAALLGRALEPGARVQHGALTLQATRFFAQPDYDLLLWACDLNLVRGEDSFVRAQWAARPLLWNIYPQAADAHRAKLDAFLQRYCAGLAPEAAAILRQCHTAWNGDGPLPWDALIGRYDTLAAHAAAWAESLAKQPDLASKLVIFCENQV